LNLLLFLSSPRVRYRNTAVSWYVRRVARLLGPSAHLQFGDVTTDTGLIDNRLSHPFRSVLIRCRDCAGRGWTSGIGTAVNKWQQKAMGSN